MRLRVCGLVDVYGGRALRQRVAFGVGRSCWRRCGVAVLRACAARTKEEQNERETGFEPMTYRAAIDCSTTELPAHSHLAPTRATSHADPPTRTTFEQHHTQTSHPQPNAHATRQHAPLRITIIVRRAQQHTLGLFERPKHLTALSPL